MPYWFLFCYYRNKRLVGRFTPGLCVTTLVMIFVTPSSLAASMCFGSGKEQTELYHREGSRGMHPHHHPFLVLVLKKRFVCICLEKNFLLKNWTSKKHHHFQFGLIDNISIYTFYSLHQSFWIRYCSTFCFRSPGLLNNSFSGKNFPA